MQNSNGSPTITATLAPEIIKESRIQPVWHVIVLNLLTVCFYAPIWFYKNANDLANRLKYGSEIGNDVGAVVGSTSEDKPTKLSSQKSISSQKTTSTQVPAFDKSQAAQESPARISIRDASHELLAPISTREKNSLDLVKRVPPLSLIFGMALPVINFFLGTFFFKMLAEIYPDDSSIIRRKPLMLGAILALLFVLALSLCKLPQVYFLLYVPAVCVPLSIAQHWLNKYWSSVELDKELMIRHSFSTLELVMLIFGIMLLGLIIASFCIVPFDVQH